MNDKSFFWLNLLMSIFLWMISIHAFPLKAKENTFATRVNIAYHIVEETTSPLVNIFPSNNAQIWCNLFFKVETIRLFDRGTIGAFSRQYGFNIQVNSVHNLPLPSFHDWDRTLMLAPTQPLQVEMAGTLNTICRGCYYEGPSILINEVMLAPASYDGSIYGTNSDQRGEWIELYNPHKCDSVDISCYFLGNNAPDLYNYGGGFSIPPGTVIPPQGFALIRGRNAPLVPTDLLLSHGGNTVEIVVNSRVCIDGGYRLWFPNAGGWFAFYNDEGVPQDAISWSDSTNSCNTCFPCNPYGSGCSYSGILPSYANIPSNKKTRIANMIQSSNVSYRRIPDGGAWQYNIPATPTYGACNSICNEEGGANCTGMAFVAVSGGVAPYSYSWNDQRRQTTDTAYQLCAGTYCVTVTDAIGDTVMACYTVIDYEIPAGFIYDTICQGDNYHAHGFEIDSSETQEAGTIEHRLVTQNSNNCDSTLILYLTIQAKSYSTEERAIPNSRLPYTWGDSVFMAPGSKILILQNHKGCDSIVTRRLSIIPTIYHDVDTAICESALPLTWHTLSFDDAGMQSLSFFASNGGDSVVSYRLTIYHNSAHSEELIVVENDLPFQWNDSIFTEQGSKITILKNRWGCDSILTMSVIVRYNTERSIDTAICEDQLPFTWNGFIFHHAEEIKDTTLNEDGTWHITTMTLIVNYANSSNITGKVCRGEDYIENGFNIGRTQTQIPGIENFQLITSNMWGCDSVVNLQLMVQDLTTRIANLTTDFCTEKTALLEVISALDNVLWSTGETTQTIRINKHGLYYVTAFDEKCEVTDQIVIEPCELELYIPNAISPSNADGINDYFYIDEQITMDMQDFKISIYDRWGGLVFYSTDKNFRWTAVMDGKIFANNVYSYVIFVSNFNGKQVVYKGSITVL
ncbi:MAG: gliding motility-associated C-terminal domain-containing protein [Bacteroidales bacterium]